MKFKLIFFILLLNCFIAIGQYKTMLHKPYNKKIEAIDVLYRNTINKDRKDSLYISSYTTKMQQWALSNNDKELALEAELLNAYANWFLYGYKNPLLIDGLKDIAEKGNKNKIYHVEERATQVIATHYWNQKNYEVAFEWLLQSAEVLEKITSENFPNMASHLNFIGRCYYNFEDYNKALVYYKKSANLKKSSFNANAVLEAQSTVGLCYQKTQKLKLAEQYFLAVIKDTSIYKSKTWVGIASGNLGYNYYLEKNFKKAIPLLKEDFQNAIKINEPNLAAGATITLADIYLKQNKLEKAKQKIKESREYIKTSKQTDRLRNLYPIISKWYSANKQTALSAVYLDSTIIAINNYNKKYSSLKLLRANQKVAIKNKEIEVEKLRTQGQLKLTQRNYIILIVAILLITSTLFFWFRNKYLLKEREIKVLALENAQKALENSKNKLKNLTKKIREDSNLITELQKNEASKNNLNLLSQLKSKNILTKSDWQEFQNLFREVYPNFIQNFTSSYPDLSQAEIRCLCLEKLELTNNEIALILGVSANTIRVTKHRIRKKTDTLTNKSLSEMIKKNS